MIRVSALERMLVTDRLRRRSSYSAGDFSTPVLQEVTLGDDVSPLVVTNMRNSFVLTRRSLDGVARYAFTECPLDQEGALLTELFRVLWDLSIQHQWPTRCTSLRQGVVQMSSLGVEPKHLIVAYSLLAEACGAEVTIEEAERRMALQGYVGETQGLRVLAAAIPARVAMVVAGPSVAGFYTRVDNRLGVMIKQANRSVVLVNLTEPAQEAVAE